MTSDAHPLDALLHAAAALPAPAVRLADEDRPLRLPVAEVFKENGRQIVAGRLLTGRLSVGESLVLLPSNKTVQIAAIEGDGAPLMSARAGDAVRLVLGDHVAVERGQTAAHLEQAPAMANSFRVRLLWRGGGALAAGSRLRLRFAAAEHAAEIVALDWVEAPGRAADALPSGSVGEAVVRSRGLLALDTYADNPATGRFALLDDGGEAGGGVVVEIERRIVKSRDITQVSHRVMAEERWQANGHRGGIIWLTGLSGSGKSTIAMETERALFRRGYHVFVIDGDNVRYGLNADLGFSPKDRSENIRRVAEVASLFAQAGMLVITAFISPYVEDRQRARACAPGHFHEVYVKADLATCEARDPKGLYKKARAGQIPEFTGIDAPYEAPEGAELELETGVLSIEQTVADLVAYVEHQFSLR